MFHERLLRELNRSLWMYRWRRLTISKIWTEGGDVHILLQNEDKVNCDAAVDDTPPLAAAAVTSRTAEEQMFETRPGTRWL